MRYWVVTDHSTLAVIFNGTAHSVESGPSLNERAAELLEQLAQSTTTDLPSDRPWPHDVGTDASTTPSGNPRRACGVNTGGLGGSAVPGLCPESDRAALLF